MKFRKLLLGAIVFASMPSAMAADLMQVYRLAIANDAQYAAARQQYKAIRENRPLARSALLPQVNLSASATRNHVRYQGVFASGRPVPNGSSDYSSAGYTLSLSQTVFNYADWVALKQADKTVAAAQANLDQTAQTLILSTAEAYFNVLSAQDQLRFSEENQRAIHRQLEQAKKRYEVGLVPSTDVKQAMASYDLARAQTIKALNAVNTAKESLTVLTGRPVEKLAPLVGRIPLISPAPQKMKAWVHAALKQNLNLIASRLDLQASRENVNAQRAGHYPTVSLVASHNYVDNGAGASTTGKISTDAIALQINVPLFSGFRVNSLTDQAQYQYLQAQQNLVGLERQIISQTRTAYLNVESAISQVKALRLAVKSNEASVKATEAGFKVGTRTSLDVLTALADLYQAQSEYSQARYAYLIDTLKLKLVSGLLTVSDLEHINAYLAKQG